MDPFHALFLCPKEKPDPLFGGQGKVGRCLNEGERNQGGLAILRPPVRVLT